MNGKQLKNSILQWAIQGKLVPQDPNDEPASVLLDKIRQEKERLIKERKSSVTRTHPLSTVVRTIHTKETFFLCPFPKNTHKYFICFL